MAGKPQKPWYLFSFLDLPIFDDAEVQAIRAVVESRQASTSQPSKPITNNTLEEPLDALKRHCLDTLPLPTSGTTDEHKNERISELRQSSINDISEKPSSGADLPCSEILQTRTCGATDEDKEECASRPRPSAINNIPKKPVSFLDLPGELRNQIYNLVRPSQCKKLRAVLYDPQIFDEDQIPRRVDLDIRAWSCYEFADLRNWECGEHEYENICDNTDCGKSARDFLKLTSLNRQIRKEVNCLLYGRWGWSGCTYNFRTIWNKSCGKHGSTEAVFRLNKAGRYNAQCFGSNGVPYAVLRTRTWFSWIGWYRYELLVPDWAGREGVSWRKLSDIEDNDTEYLDWVLVSQRDMAKGKISDEMLPWYVSTCQEYIRRAVDELEAARR